MTSTFTMAAGAEILLSIGFILLIVLAIFLMARRRKPDSKVTLLLSLMEAMPKDREQRETREAVRGEAGGRGENALLGPSGFTLSA
ncbi:MAG: hypothetical protein ACM3NO_07090 [Deltaproteobacteria bacterium]